MEKEKYIILRDREVMLTPLYWNTVSQTSQKSKQLFGVNQQLLYSYFKNGRNIQIYLKKYWNRAGEHIANLYFENINFLKKIKKLVKVENEEINRFILVLKKNNLSKLLFIELVNSAKKIEQQWLAYDEINVPPWFWAGDYFSQKLKINLRTSQDEYLILTTPVVITYASQLDSDLLKKIKLVKSNNSLIKKAAESLSNKYGWIPFGYDGLEYWDSAYFVKRIIEVLKDKNWQTKISKDIQGQKNVKRQKNKIIKKYKFNNRQIELIGIMNELALWTDERKKFEFTLHYHYSQILLEIGRRLKISYKNLKYLFVSELADLEKKKKELIRSSNLRMSGEFMLEIRNENIKLLGKQEKNIILKELQKQNKAGEIKGQVASSGLKTKYQGIAKIILSPTDSYKINNGDILVATMTSPDYIVAMNKAAGFITDEGGVTCHAAIVAREMNKPCIIGTKIATKLLKDGDLIDMNMGDGIIRKL